MQAYVLRRVLLMVPLLFGVSVVVFAMVRVLPGDVATLMVAGGQDSGASGVNEETIQAIRRSLYLDQPLHVQYGIWLWQVARGDLGTSYWTKRPILDEIGRALPITIELAVLAVLISVLVGVPLGVVSAVRQDTGLDYAGRLFSIGALSLPDFWIGTMLVLFPLLWFGWIPSIKYTPLLVDPGPTYSRCSSRPSPWASTTPGRSCGSPARRCWRYCGRTTCARPGRRGWARRGSSGDTP